MKKIVFAALIVVGSTLSAFAADLPYKAPVPPPAPPCIWCGWYVGVNGGWIGNADSQPGSLSALGTDPLENVFVTQAATYNVSSGGFGGGQIGYNWQLPGGPNGPSNWLVGVEADIQGARLLGSSALSFAGDSDNLHTATASSRLDWFGTLRGRLGFTTGNALFYGTGGLAFAGVRNNLLVTEADGGDCVAGVNATICASAANAGGSTTRTGYVVGAGIEYLFAPGWSVKFEYQYMDLGTVNQIASATVTDTTDPTEGTFGSHRVTERFNTVRVGLNYHFGGPVVAKY